MKNTSLLLLILATLLVGSCSDDSSGTNEDAGSDGILDTNGDTNDDVPDLDAEDDTNDVSDDDAQDGDTSTDTEADSDLPDTPGDGDDADMDMCTGGTLCGMPATCCPAGNECINGACLPTCDSGIRCGTDNMTCCAAGELCLAGACAEPGAMCQDSYDCMQPGEFCEPTLGQCLPQPNPLTCEVVPSFSQLSTTIEWQYSTEEVISPPFVADLNDDGTPEVILNATRTDGGSWPSGKIVVLDGVSGTEEWRVEHNPPTSFGSHGRSSVAIGDVSGDGLPDIVYAGRTDRVHAINHEGTLLWTAVDTNGTEVVMDVENGAVSLANFDGDPEAEIVIGATLIDNDGTVVWDEGGQGESFGTNAGYRGGISAIADLDDDGNPEIVSGRDAWKVSWQPPAQMGDPPQVTVTPYWSYAGDDGYPAVADLDLNGVPEVVLVANRTVTVLNGQTGELWCGVDQTGVACQNDPGNRTQPISIPGQSSNNRGGPPTIADFDADGRPEVGVAGGWSYSVYDFNRSNEVIVQPPGDPLPQPGDIYVRWSQTTQDQSSNATGSSVFDFQGDGVAEVVYADECFMRVYSGTDGTVELEVDNHSATIHEYPIVVDVDADGNSEILFVSNGGNNCSGVPGWNGPTAGIFVYGDANDEWVPTRRVWNQHAYHVTNVGSDGNVPMVEDDNWSLPGLNNYRQNVQGEGVFNAPDLELDLSVGLDLCPGEQLELRARVSNAGALGVPAGISVAFYEGTDNTGTLLSTGTTSAPLLPGASTVVTAVIAAPTMPTDYYAEVDNDGTGTSTVVECDETNNGEGTTSVLCQFN